MIDDWTEYHRNYYYKRRQQIWDYLGGKCVRCGKTEHLEVDHIDRTQKSFNINENLTLNNPAVRAELDKCQLLCEEHHWQKTGEENRGFKHGTYYAFQTKRCTCEVCESAKREWYDRRNERRRGVGATKRGPYKTAAEHGEVRRYYRGCRCDKCRAANTAHARERDGR